MAHSARLARYDPLVRALLPHANLVTRGIVLLAATALTALAAQVEVRVPGSPVPITGQTFAVVAIAAALGARAGAAAMLLYIAEGVAGLPVFAGGASGPGALAGPTGGYLLGFIPAAYLTGWLAERGLDRNVWTAFFAMLLGSVPIFACGLAWLARFVPPETLLAQGLYPFVFGDVVKSLLAAGVLPGAWALLRAMGVEPRARA